ncbi:hypothetical protein BD779DRAFT_1613269 [Infundibulicybe gibba]|nr:hypothetical protein BD779DRAFT_1613269 [Infundibulicybe gibba]
MSDIALYLHSSGSTGFPRAIPQTYLGIFECASFSLPPFHAHGFYCQVAHPMYGTLSVSVYPPVPITPSPDNIIKHLRGSGANWLITVPGLLHTWHQSKDAIRFLQKAVFVGYAGGPLSKTVGDILVGAGVNLKTIYGATESWGPNKITLERRQEVDWDWVEFSSKAKIRWAEQGDGTYECQLLTTDTYHPSVENMREPPGYATSDLFEKHPTKNLWKIVGRIDDVITHSSGEKTVPGPMEKIIMGSPLVSAVVMFGRNHDHPGILIEPATVHKVESRDLEILKKELWPTIEQANASAPAFSRIFKEMVLVASPEKLLPKTSKGTVMRKLALTLYAEEIEAYIGTNDFRVIPPEDWQEKAVKNWLLEQADDMHPGRTFSTTHDLFEQGFDSLSATFLRLRMIGALKSSSDPCKVVGAIPFNIIYMNPTIAGLTNYITNLVAFPGGGPTINEQVEAASIQAMVTKYTPGLDTPLRKSSPHSERRNQAISKIFAFNRPAQTNRNLYQRQFSAFSERGLDTHLLNLGHLILLEGDLTQANCGLNCVIYDQLQREVDTIIHCAWKLDFNLALPSFESNIHGTRNLIELARSGAHAETLRFIFASSVAASVYPRKNERRGSLKNGYGQSKYVTEKILEMSGLQTTCLRIDQIMSEWVPILVKSSLVLGALPIGGRAVTWLPVNTISDITLKIGFSVEVPPRLLYLVHPQPISWENAMTLIGCALIRKKEPPTPFPTIPFRDWVQRLQREAEQATKDTLKKLPAIKLLDFFHDMARAGEVGIHEHAVTNTILLVDPSTSQILKTLQPIGSVEVNRWVEYWSAVGWFDECAGGHDA